VKLGGAVWTGLGLVALGLPLFAYAQGPTALKPVIARAHPTVRWLSVDRAADWFSQDRAVWVDARSRAEFEVSHVPGAIHMKPGGPLPALDPTDRRPVVVYCSVGWRSAKAAERLAADTTRSVHNLTGGIFEWANRGLPLEDSDGPAPRVHPYDWSWGRLLRPERRAALPTSQSDPTRSSAPAPNDGAQPQAETQP
jgi:rhodanese-related sulfurtransferase